ncbi:MAG: hypothetical protein WED07_13625 [Candidatus Freyarchaeum deiterrae]
MSRKKVTGIKVCASCGTETPSDALYCPHCVEPIDPSYLYGENLFSEGSSVEGREVTREELSIKPGSQNMSGIFPYLIPYQTLYEGVIQGLVTGELMTNLDRNEHYNGSYFTIKLEEDFEGVPKEILVSVRLNYLRIGDKVTLQGKIIKEVLKKWRKPNYLILADRVYNESLNIGTEVLMVSKQVIYKGIIRGLVTEGSRLLMTRPSFNLGSSFLMKLDENMGIAEIPDELLVQTSRGYFRKGDKVILEGKIFRITLKKIERPTYAIKVDHFYNESLQIGDGGIVN